jgi:hypothetical protein
MSALPLKDTSADLSKLFAVSVAEIVSDSGKEETARCGAGIDFHMETGSSTNGATEIFRGSVKRR